MRTPVSNTSAIVLNRKALIIYDIGPCFWVAEGILVHGRTGGEYIWCQSLIGQLIELGKEVYVTNSSKIAKELSLTSHLNGNNMITISHWGWQEIAVPQMFIFRSKYRIPVPSIGADCLIKMNFWGTEVATEIWPGSLKNYLTVYPSIGGKDREGRYSYGSRAAVQNKNTASGFGDQFVKCGDEDISRTLAHEFEDGKAGNFSLLDLAILRSIQGPSANSYHSGSRPLKGAEHSIDGINGTRFHSNVPYYIVFGKFGKVVSTKKIPSMLRNSNVWAFLQNKDLNGIVLHCDERLFPTLQANSSQFTCLEPTSIFKRAPYYHLLLSRAVFVLGLGVPVLSTTPFEALTCSTPVILPTGQHTFLEGSADSSSPTSSLFHGVGSAESLKAAVDTVMLAHNASQLTGDSTRNH
jgi:hypothetical protein